MTDNTKNVGSPDRDRIAIGEEHEVRYWTQALGITKERLQQAVDAVGNSAAEVRQHLKGQDRGSNRRASRRLLAILPEGMLT